MASHGRDQAWKRGWLLKKRGTAWTRHFFVLEPPMLYAYECEGGKPVGVICIEGALTFVVPTPDALEGRCLRVVVGGRSHWFATADDEVDQWRSLLDRAQGHRRRRSVIGARNNDVARLRLEDEEVGVCCC